MVILLLFAFLSGLVTIFAPCIWPLLPIILSTSTTGEKRKPLGLTLGILLSFAVVTLAISYIVKIIPFDPNVLRLFAVIVIGFLGLSLIIPKLSQLFEGYVSRLSGRFSPKKAGRDGFAGGFITGIALGIVWSPCAGPILATIATLAATRAVNFQIILVTVFYVVGIGIPLFLFATLGNRLFLKSRGLNKYTGIIQQIFGVIMILTAVAIFTNYDKVLETKLLNVFPSYSDLLLKLENNQAVTNELNAIKNGKNTENTPMPFPQASLLHDYGPAPDFTGIAHWLNSQPLTMPSLRGKVVLVDFWTYTCINCIRTLPYITSWYEKYKDKDFVVIGVHTPEFLFEHDTQNVQSALVQYKIHYPVAQDNDYETWNAYNNQYWPAHYLIDAKGIIRYIHFGEGEYENTEKAIRQLIAEAGVKIDSNQLTPEQNPNFRNLQTPETYVGTKRMERFASNETANGGQQVFTLPPSIPQHNFGFSGTWNVQEEYAESVQNSVLELNFIANKVYLVITPKSKQDLVKVILDGKVIDEKNAGADVQNGYVKFDTERLYNLVNFSNDNTGHILRLEFQTPGTKVFAFTFG